MKKRGYKREVIKNSECTEYANSEYERKKLADQYNETYQETKRKKKKINIIVTDK